MFKKVILPSLIILICFVLIWSNYASGTYLIGWDSLHPEFNFQEALKRVFFGVWREEQGLGAIAAHSHMADLPRIFFLFLESFFISGSFLRYSYVFLCLILGPLGVYFFFAGFISPLAAFLGALAYLFNLGTLQHFLVPFEMFTTQYAFLPWLFLTAYRYLEKGERKSLLIFALITVISSPQAYAATLFYAYLGALAIFVLTLKFKRGLIIILVTLLLNTYWLLPNVYSVLNQSPVIVKAKINQLFSPEVRLRNLSYENFPDVLIHKNFLFDWRAFDFKNNSYQDLMAVWKDRLANSNHIFFYLIPSFAFLGMIFLVIKRERIGFAMLAVTVYSLFFLMSTPFATFEALKEALRMPFTKFSIIFMFSLSFFFGCSFAEIVRKKLLGLVGAIIMSGVLISSFSPTLSGELISPIVKKDFPKEYVELFKWFKGKPGRIALLPLNTMWGWNYQNWKYEGSGFLTYGLANPLLMRDFDRWSAFNETFYNEANKAFTERDFIAFHRILEKYQVKYLLWDGSIVNPEGKIEKTVIPEVKEVVKFNFLTVYDTGISNSDYFVKTINNYTLINADLTYSSVDPVYARYGNYIQSTDGLGLPFVNFDPRGPVQIQIQNSKIKMQNLETGSKVILPVEGRISESFGSDRGYEEANNCDLKKAGTVARNKLSTGWEYQAGGGGISCDYFNYSNLKHNQAYVLRVKGENFEGRSLKIYLANWETKRVELEELLPEGKFNEYYVIYPKDSQETGYTLNVETRSFGKISSRNLVEVIEFVPFDIDFITRLYIDAKTNIYRTGNLKVKNVRKVGTAFYKVVTSGSGLLVLSQGYEKGWLGFTLDGLKFNLLPHVKVNSWANGWLLKESQTPLYLFFWPQALEWLGFLILAVSGLFFLTVRKNKL